MNNDTKCAKKIMKNIANLLLNEQNRLNLTNAGMATKLEMSLSEYNKLINRKRKSKYGCSAVTIYKLCHNTGISFDDIYNI